MIIIIIISDFIIIKRKNRKFFFSLIKKITRIFFFLLIINYNTFLYFNNLNFILLSFRNLYNSCNNLLLIDIFEFEYNNENNYDINIHNRIIFNFIFKIFVKFASISFNYFIKSSRIWFFFYSFILFFIHFCDFSFILFFEIIIFILLFNLNSSNWYHSSFIQKNISNWLFNNFIILFIIILYLNFIIRKLWFA